MLISISRLNILTQEMHMYKVNRNRLCWHFPLVVLLTKTVHEFRESLELYRIDSSSLWIFCLDWPLFERVLVDQALLDWPLFERVLVDQALLQPSKCSRPLSLEPKSRSGVSAEMGMLNKSYLCPERISAKQLCASLSFWWYFPIDPGLDCRSSGVGSLGARAAAPHSVKLCESCWTS